MRPLRTAYCVLLTTPCLLSTFFCLLLTHAAVTAHAEPPLALPVDGEAFAAELRAIDAQWQVTLESKGARRVLPAADLVRWGTCAEASRGPLLVLGDGGLLVADVLEADKQRLQADSGLFGVMEIPLERLAGVVFDLPADQHARDLLVDRVASSRGDSDRVLLANGDEVAGALEGIHDKLLRLATVVGQVDVEAHRVAALVFNPALVERPKRTGLCTIAGFRDGSRLIAERLIWGENSLAVELGRNLRGDTAPDELVFLKPLGGRVTYLSDLKPEEYRHVPFLDLPWAYQADRSVTGGLLRAGGRLYLKGIGMHSAGRLTYRLAEPYRRFQAQVALDDSAGARGSVRFRVFLDSKEVLTTPTVRGGEPPRPVSVDLAGARRLDLVVDYADRADELDRAAWLDARLVR